MAILLPGEPIAIRDKTRREKLGHEISERLVSLEELNKPLFDDIRLWWQQYEAIPRLKVKNFPFRNASNVVIPLAKIQIEAMVARTMDKVFAEGHRVWDMRTENEGNEDLGRNLVRYMNWQADDNDFDFRTSMEDWLREFFVIGSAVFAGNWREHVGHVYAGMAGGKVKVMPIQYARGPIAEHVPRHLIQWDHSTTISDTALISRQYDFSFSELAQRAAADPKSWFQDELAACRGSIGSSGPAEQVRRAFAEMDSQKQDGERNLAFGSGHDIREVHIRYPLDQLRNMERSDIYGTGAGMKDVEIDVPIVASIHMKTKRLVRLVAAPYHIQGFPFYEGYYSKRPGRGHSVGVTKEVEQLSIAMTTVFNQGIDAQTRSNAIFAKTRDVQHLDNPIDPQTPIFDPTNSFEPLSVPGAGFANFQLIQVIQGITERLTGQGDAQFGRETSMGGHPSPATSTMAMLQNSEILLAPRHGQVAKVLARVGMFIASVNQQFETDENGKLKRVLGEIDGELVNEWIFPREPIPGNYVFSIKGLSRSLNSQQRMERSIQLYQLGQQYWGGILAATKALGEMLQMQSLPPEIMEANIRAYFMFIGSQNETYKDLLQSADVDEVEKFLFSLENFTGDSKNALQQFIGSSQQQAATALGPGGMGQPQSPQGQPGMGNIQQAPPFGAGGTTGIPT